MDETLKTALHADEKILWEGKAASFTTLDKTNKPFFWISLAIGLAFFAALTAAYVRITTRSGGDLKWGVLAVILVLALLAPIRCLSDAGKIRKLRYLATDQRLMVLSDSGFRSAAYGRIDQAAFRTDADGVTSLLCGRYAVKAKERKRREIAVIGMVGGDRNETDQPIESFGFYALSKQDVGALRGILKQQCPTLKL